MIDDTDGLLEALALSPPQGFATRVVALSRHLPQSPPKLIRFWQWLSLAAGAGIGAVVVGEFVFSAFSVAIAL